MSTEMCDIEDLIGDELAGALAMGLAPADLGSAQRARMRERIVSRVCDIAPAGTFTLRAKEQGWQSLDDRVRIRVLRRDEAAWNLTVLIRMLPGGVIDGHGHTQEEECFVLSGEIEIGAHCLRAGDMHVVSAGTRHGQIRSRTGALLLVRSEIPAEFAGLT